MKNKKINEEFKPNFDKEIQKRISEDFCDYFSKITGISKKEFEEYGEKVRSGEIKLDNNTDV
jgi:hypothetical protein